MLKIEDISIGYGKKVIIEDISIDISTNEFIGLLGLNGAGKTTLLKAISGLLRPISGQCLLFGKDIYQYTEKERAKNISYMPQRHSIFYDINVSDVVLMGITPYLGIFQTPTKYHKELAYEMLKKMGAEKLANENFLHLSEGQKQVIVIARNLLQNSRIMLFDEPDSALDFNNKHMVISKIKDIIKKEEKVGIITLHDPNMAMKYCDRIIVLKNKKKIADFYTGEVNADLVREVFNEIYDEIKIIKQEETYLIVR